MAKRDYDFKLLLHHPTVSNITPLALGIPASTNPTTIPVTLPADAQTGDILGLRWSQSQSFASGVTNGAPQTLNTAVDTPGSTITGFGIPTLSTGAPWYFQGFITRNGVLSIASNTVSWPLADATGPVISTSTTQSVAELATLSVALAANKTVASWTITGGADQLQFQITGTTLQWYGNGTQNYDTPLTVNGTNSYVVIVTATDLAGNTTPITITISVTAIAKQPTFTPSTLTGVNNATHGVPYTSASFVESAVAPGLAIPITVQNGTYSKNGGPFVSTNGTGVNGDSFQLQGSTTGTTIVTFTGSPGTHQRQITFTISDGAAQLANSGIDYNTSIALSGSPRLTYTTNGGTGNTDFVRATRAAATSHTYMEVTLTSWTGSVAGSLGLDNRTVDFSASSAPTPGYSDSTGINMNAFNGLNINAQGTNVPIAQPSNGQVIGIEFTSSTVKFTNATLGTTLGSIANPLGTAALYFFGGQGGGGATIVGTVNFTGPYVGSVPVGANNY